MRFHQTGDKPGLSGTLLAEVNRQLDARGLIVKMGTLVDATIIAAAVKVARHDEGQVKPRNPDAASTIKNDETHLGRKPHLAVDEPRSGTAEPDDWPPCDLNVVKWRRADP